MKRLLFFCFIVFAKISFANDTIIVNKDARIDMLSQKQVQQNKRAAMLTSGGQYKGFRLQVISTNNREEAFRIKADLLTKFPEQKTYALFQSHNFKIRIGNFLRREEAEKFRAQVAKFYPDGVYIVEDAIEYTPTDDDVNNQ